MKSTNIDITELLRAYNQNPDNKRLKTLYGGRTVFDIIGKGRNETAHSAFLEWLLSGHLRVANALPERRVMGLSSLEVKQVAKLLLREGGNVVMPDGTCRHCDNNTYGNE